MNIKELERDLLDKCSKLEGLDVKKEKTAITSVVNHLKKEWNFDINELGMQELNILSSSILTQATKSTNEELQDLILQKERIERELDRKTNLLQSKKHQLFSTLESVFQEKDANDETISKLHSVELHSMDLLCLLEEMIESAIITTLEKGSNIEETIEELSKEITMQTLDEGILSASRIRHVISTILKTAINVADATPNSAEDILEGTIKGIRTGLIKALDRFKQKFLFTPDEAKIILIEDPQSLYNELHYTDTIFIQTIEALASQSSSEISTILETILNDIRYDMEELNLISKETLDIVSDKLSEVAKNAMQKSSEILKSKKAEDAKKMGVQAWGIARSVLDGAIKGAKDAIDKK